ncbi:MAG: glycerophosphodiester phosphodiesterase [Dysgonamonadaceae bacterium]|jgi:glycerophosphoryl diester phosphodiesterase|nr:glycerophosphodiester phosphodiesterase [Dysgonamonadaceae bacterium]
MKWYFTLILLTVLCNFDVFAQTKVIAHRGYWDCEGSAQNSIFGLKKAQEIGIYGSEFDVIITSDGIPVINHDSKIKGSNDSLLTIENTPFEQIKGLKLKNGELLPTLESYLEQGKKNKKTKLILEIKPHSTKEIEDKAVKIITEMVSKSGMEKQTEYISFSMNICKEILRYQPKAEIAYLNGDFSPSEVKKAGLTGLDYHFEIFRTHPEWIAEAKKLGLTTNVWTVNDLSIMRKMIDLKVDFITTDKPEILKSLLYSNKKAGFAEAVHQKSTHYCTSQTRPVLKTNRSYFTFHSILPTRILHQSRIFL